MYRCYIVNCPALFHAVWAAVKPLLDKRIQKKIMIYGKVTGKVMDEMVTLFGGEERVPAFMGACAQGSVPVPRLGAHGHGHGRVRVLGEVPVHREASGASEARRRTPRRRRADSFLRVSAARVTTHHREVAKPRAVSRASRSLVVASKRRFANAGKTRGSSPPRGDDVRAPRRSSSDPRTTERRAPLRVWSSPWSQVEPRALSRVVPRGRRGARRRAPPRPCAWPSSATPWATPTRVGLDGLQGRPSRRVQGERRAVQGPQGRALSRVQPRA